MSFLTGKEQTVLGAAVAALVANAVLTFGNLSGLVAVQGDVTRSYQVLAELARLDRTMKERRGGRAHVPDDGGSDVARGARSGPDRPRDQARQARRAGS